MGRREDKRELTRQQMLDAAAVLFAERGYENTSIDDVAEKANVSKGTFYYHFESKETLVIELRRSYVSETVDQSYELLAQGVAPLTVLEKLLLERASVTQKQPELSKIFYAQRIQQFFFKDEDLRPNADGTSKPRRFRRLIYELICEAQKRGHIRADLAPQELAGMIVACFLHAQGAWLAGEHNTSVVEKVHRWLHALLDGVAVKGYRDETHCFTPDSPANIAV